MDDIQAGLDECVVAGQARDIGVSGSEVIFEDFIEDDAGVFELGKGEGSGGIGDGEFRDGRFLPVVIRRREVRGREVEGKTSGRGVGVCVLHDMNTPFFIVGEYY